MSRIVKAIPVYLVVMSVLTLVAHAGGRVVSFGHSSEVPAENVNIQAVAAGYMHSLALSDDGKVIAWGANQFGQATVPSACHTGVEAIAAGGSHSLALTVQGGVIAWGDHAMGQSLVPSAAQSSVRSISAGLLHSLALTRSGRVVAWGDTSFGQGYVPDGLTKVVAISAGALHSMALRNDGRVFVWGDNSFRQGNVPSRATSGIKAISAGYFHNLALTESGEVIAWGDNTFGQCDVPVDAREGVIAIAAGQDQSLALKANGVLVTWGGESGRIPATSGNTLPVLNSIAAGGFHSLGIVPEGADSNGNGIPDWWEIQNSIDPAEAHDATSDSDEDGLSDQEEYLADTDPWDAGSYLKVDMAYNRDTAQLELMFSPVSSERTYTLEYASDFTKGAWRAVGGMSNMRMQSSASQGKLTVDNRKEQRIYRLVVSTP